MPYDRRVKRRRVRLRTLGAGVALSCACHTPQSHPRVDAVTSVIAPPSVNEAAASSRPTKTCGATTAALTGGAVTGFVSSPASIELGTTNGKRALVLSDPKWAQCDIVIEERGALPGPFSGASGSDATWKAVFYSGASNVYVVVLDGSGAVQGLQSVPFTPFGNQGRIEARDVFTDGHTILYSGGVPGDGWEDIETSLFGFADGKLVVLYKYVVSVGMGALERLDVTTSASPPTVTVDLSTHDATVPSEDGGFRTLKAEKRHTVARWDGRRFR